MSKNRPARVGDEIRRLLADLIQNEVKDPRIPLLTSVTDVEMSSDLSHAVIFVSVFGSPEEQANCLKALSGANGFLRREVGRKLRIRVIPELHFRLDTSIEDGNKMSRLIDEVLAKDSRAEADASEDNSDSEETDDNSVE